MRDAAAKELPARVDSVPELLPYDGGAGKVLQLAFREALRLGHKHVGTGHLLLALLGYGAGTGVLAKLAVDTPAAVNFVTQTVAAAQADAEANHAEWVNGDHNDGTTHTAAMARLGR